MKLTMVLIMSVCGMNAFAQKTHSGRHPLKKITIYAQETCLDRDRGKIQVCFKMNPSALNLKSNQSILLIPTLESGEKVKALPAVMLCGRRQYIMMRRFKGEEMKKKGIDLLWFERYDETRDTIGYQSDIQYEEWMDNADLYLNEDLCGCGDKMFLQARTRIDRKTPAVFEVHPQLVYVNPKVEAIKERMEVGRAYLNFPVNNTNIIPGYYSNERELDKIQKSIELILHEPGIKISGIKIHGYASPEGTYCNNARLAEGRAMALKEYVKNRYDFNDTICQVETTPEDWNGLIEYAGQSETVFNKQLYSFLESSKHIDPDLREMLMRKRIGEKHYRQLLKEVYPFLRHSDYTIKYIVKGFDIEEGKRYLKSRPGLLSLQEMYLIAATYPENTFEFKEIFDIAVRLFPDDETANLNAANAALEDRNFEKAKTYLEKSGTSGESEYAWGIYYLLQDKFGQANSYLERSLVKGVPHATDALKQLLEREKYLNTYFKNQ